MKLFHKHNVLVVVFFSFVAVCKKQGKNFRFTFFSHTRLFSFDVISSFINFLDRRFDFIDHSQFLNIFVNVANVESWRQWNEIKNPHQLVAASRHVSNCNCEIDNHFMNFLPFKLIMYSKTITFI